MILTITIPDELYVKYAGYDARDPKRAILNQLKRFADFSPTDRALLFSHEERKEIETLYQRPIEDVGGFVNWVKSLISAKIGGVEIQLSEGQAKRLISESKFFVQDPTNYLRMKLVNAVKNVLGV